MERSGKIIESVFNLINGIPSICVRHLPDGLVEVWFPGCSEKIIVPAGTGVIMDVGVEETKTIGVPVRLAAWREL